MSGRLGGGRGRGRGRFGGGSVRRYVKPVPFELFPEIEDLGTAEFSTEKMQLVRWTQDLQKFCDSSPYHYEDRKEHPTKKVQKPDIERYSDRINLQAKAKQTFFDFVKLDRDHMPAELARGEKEKRLRKRVRWNPESDWQKLEFFEQRENKVQGQEGNENKENEEEDGQVENEEDGEFSDEGDYEQNEYFDDDEDDYNMADEDNDEPDY